MDFKKLHPAGSLSAQLKTVEDIMITETNSFCRWKYGSKALKILTKKNWEF